MKNIFICFVLILSLKVEVLSSNDNFSQSVEDSIRKIQEALGYDREEAKNLLGYITKILDEVQNVIRDVSSNEISIQKKEELSRYIIKKHFIDSDDAGVQVISNVSKRIEEYRVPDYFKHISDYSASRFKYNKVIILFNRDYLKLGTVYNLGNNNYEFSISSCQWFRAFDDTIVVYEDFTMKHFIFLLYPVETTEGTKLAVKLRYIAVAHLLD